MERVIIESPLSGDFTRNRRYALWCMADSLRRGEAPFASHLLYTQCLDDEDPEARRIGMEAGFAWGAMAERVVAYIDLGRSLGMEAGLSRAFDAGVPVAYRHLPFAALAAFQRGELPSATRGFK